MAQRSTVPKFGNWESEENVPYTAYFDKARKVRTTGGKMMNPNDPEENPDLHSENAAPPSKPKSEPEELMEQGHVRPTREQMRSREDGDFKQFADSPARRGRGESSSEANAKQPRRLSGGPENNSYERSPLHHQAKPSARTVGAPSPLWEGNKGPNDGTGGGTGRSWPRTNLRGDESPDKGAAVPKFGDWDENNPASADGYTHIFNKVREERNYPGRPGTARTPSHTNTRQPPPPDSAKCCCFSWGGR